ncbi:MAG: hypothetical protein WCE75_10780 [Terracidiphilus sp.]
MTAAPVYRPLAALAGQQRFPQGAQLLRIHEGKAEPLVPDFAASADASVSFDGARVLFAGKQAAADRWQIWELTLADRSLRKVIGGAGDAIRPLYLPAGRLVYARHAAGGYQVMAAGAAQTRALAPIDAKAEAMLVALTHPPASAVPDDVLADGRVLFESNYPLGAGKTAEMFLVYSDGSGLESYRCDHGAARWAGRQMASGDVVFTHGASLARFASPLAREAAIAAPRAEFAGAIAETAQGEWLLSTRATPASRYALKAWNPGAATMRTVFAQAGMDLVEPVVLAPRARPNHHPSGLHEWNYANLLALDARLGREGDLKHAPAKVRLESLDADGHTVVNGTAPVEADGSFFVQVPGDKPIRLVLLDENGQVLRQEHGWFWSRGGEQRICVGCHTGPERGSENRVPAVLMRSTTPVDLTGAKAASKPQSHEAGGN